MSLNILVSTGNVPSFVVHHIKLFLLLLPEATDTWTSCCRSWLNLQNIFRNVFFVFSFEVLFILIAFLTFAYILLSILHYTLLYYIYIDQLPSHVYSSGVVKKRIKLKKLWFLEKMEMYLETYILFW